jgi:plastocyanin
MRLIAGLTAVLVAASGVVWAAPDSAAAASHAVVISGYAFQPASLTVDVGDTVAWTNSDQAPHDVTTTSAPVAIHGSTMANGQSWRYTFTVPGTYSYICSIHPDMKATVVVRPAATSKAAVAPARAAPATTRYTTVARPAMRSMSMSRLGSAATPHAPSSSSRSGVVRPVVATPVAAVPASSGPPERPLRPLLIVAGIVAAVATLSLLLLAARPESPRSPGLT